MKLRTQGNLLGYFILFVALVLIVLSDFINLIFYNSFIGSLLLLLGIVVAIIGILVIGHRLRRNRYQLHRFS
jgi:predicted membrane channel-forming protein YqfA (hemolysin III family)